MHTVWSIFETLTQIPHCSNNTHAMKTYITDFAKSHGYTVHVDKAENILCYKEGAKVTLQSHYDMVCMGDAPKIELEKSERYYSAKKSSLGADNGIGMAVMLLLMSEHYPVATLFTSNEEVGLVGARNLDLEIPTPYVLNLDSEEEGGVFIGCAGGVDLVAEMTLNYIASTCSMYEVTIDGLPGGHSGIDIDKNIKSANVELIEALYDLQVPFYSFNGGERRNSIAKKASAVVALTNSEYKKLEEKGFELKASSQTQIIEQSARLLNALHKSRHGVLSFNEKLECVNSSINLSIVTTQNKCLKVETTLRSMQTNALKSELIQEEEHYTSFGFTTHNSGFYAPWEASTNDFTHLVAHEVAKISGSSSLKVMHAGLECGVLQQHAKKALFASIGPNIHAPHSTKERVEIASVERFERTVRSIINAV